ncbi:MAG: hypothetical protein WC707_06945 [Candidatus Babeliaceae bacterium]
MKAIAKTGIVVGILGGIAALVSFKAKPKISIENVDFIGKKVRYKMSAGIGGNVMEGTKLYTDKTTTKKIFGKYAFLVSSEGQGFALMIIKSGKNAPVAITTINLQTKKINADLNQGVESEMLTDKAVALLPADFSPDEKSERKLNKDGKQSGKTNLNLKEFSQNMRPANPSKTRYTENDELGSSNPNLLY